MVLNMPEEQEDANIEGGNSLAVAPPNKKELGKPVIMMQAPGSSPFEKIEGYCTNIYFCVSFILSNLIAFFILPDKIHIYYLEAFTHGKSLNRFEITLFWIFLSGGILSIHFLILVLLSENMSVKKRVRRKLAKTRTLLMGMFIGGWLAMFYVQWDGVYYALNGSPLSPADTYQLIPLIIIFASGVVHAVVRWRRFCE